MDLGNSKATIEIPCVEDEEGGVVINGWSAGVGGWKNGTTLLNKKGQEEEECPEES